jgi:peptide/nickel transport system substrate-binding protein
MYEDYIAQEKPVFTFYLRKDVKWHDGESFSGKDIVFTYQTIINPKIECGATRNYYNDCEKFELVDNNPYIVRATWIRPYFDAFTFSADIDILPEHIFKFDNPKDFNEGSQNQKLIGNGPYELKPREKGQNFVLTRNENYYGRPPHFKSIVYRVVKDPNAELQLFEKGDVDICVLRPNQMNLKEHDPAFRDKFEIHRSTANSYRYIGWNARDEHFKDKQVRRALTMLIDRDRIIKDVMRGYAKPMHGTVHPENPAFWKELPNHAIPFDPENAKKLLTDAGWKDSDGDGVLDRNGVPFKFTLLIVSNSPEFESIANLIKNSMAKVGIEVSISNLEWSVLLQKVERLTFDAVLLGWRLGYAEDPYQLWHSSQIGEKQSNHCAFVNKEADRIIENCRRELNETKRFALLKRFQEIILDEQPYTFLFVSERTLAYEKRIKNVTYKLTGAEINRWWVPKELQKQKD